MPDYAQNPAPKEWNYYPAHERVTETAVAVGSVAAGGFVLSHIFTPLALGLAAGYGALEIARFLNTSSGKVIDSLRTNGFIDEQPDNILQNIVDECADAANVKKQTAFLVNEKFVRQTAPWYMRWAFNNPYRKAWAMKNMAATLTSLNIVIGTKEFLQRHTPRNLRFIMAHEIGHIKNDDSKQAPSIVSAFKNFSTRALWTGVGVTAVAGMAGMAASGIFVAGLPFLKGCALLALTSKGMTWGINYALRGVEYRADRNALYLTKDLEAGQQSVWASETGATRAPLFERGPSPSAPVRLINLHKAWEQVKDYPPLPEARTPEPSRAPCVYADIAP